MEDKPYRRHRSGSVVWPAILISVGVILLLQQFGYVQWTLWEISLRLWPVLIIAIGLDILFGRRSVLGSLLALILVLALFFGAVGLMGVGPATAKIQYANVPVTLPKTTAGAVRVELVSTSGTLTVDALGAGAENGLEAQIQDVNGSRLDVSTTENARQGDYHIRMSGPETIWIPNLGTNQWRTNLAVEQPLELRLSLGAGDMTLHLERLNLENLVVNLGAGQINLWLPEKGVANAKISLGTGQVVLHRAESGALAIDCTTGVGNCSLPGKNGFWSQKFQSSDFNSAAVKSEVKVTVGAGSVSVP